MIKSGCGQCVQFKNPCLSVFPDDRCEHAACRLSVVEGIVVPERVADVPGHGVEGVAGEVRPSAAGSFPSAEGSETRAGNAEVVQCAGEHAQIELSVVCDDHVSAGQEGKEFVRNCRKLRRITDILRRYPVDRDEILSKEIMPRRRANQPVAGFGQFAVNKDRDPGGADAGVRVVCRFKIEAGEFHGSGILFMLSLVGGPSPGVKGIVWGQFFSSIFKLHPISLLGNHPLMRQLSKSKIIAFRQCPKRLWLEIHRPELREDSEATEAAFQVGYEVGDTARRIYDPLGQGTLIDINTEGFKAAFEHTAELLANSRSPIFEAAFRIHGALALADVLLPDWKDGKPAWRMIEVKSSTSVKDYHHDDIAVQSFIARSSGTRLTSVALAHIDSSWTYPGGGDYAGLLAENDFTDETEARAGEVGQWLAGAQEIAAQPVEPDVATGPQCSDPFDCGFCNYCNRDKVFPEYPLTSLPRFSQKRKTACEELGIEDLRNVPDDLLGLLQQRVKSHTVSQTEFFDAEGAKAALAPYGFPALFLDFETSTMPVPFWKGTRPYEQMPFQFSLHTLMEDGSLEHAAFLDLTGNDPCASFARALVEACGKDGPIFVYNAKFEKRIISESATRLPEFAEQLESLSSRIVDLLPIAQNFYYHPSQHGSWSIKAVLPAVCPDLSYESLEGVQDGGGAMAGFREAIHPETSPERKFEIEQQLLAYCRLDTFAMVRLWQVFSGRQDLLIRDPQHEGA